MNIKKIKKSLTVDLVISIAIFLLTFYIYLKNLSPSVYGGDSGDLLAAAITKGVPHPSGYPTFTMLGILFNTLPFSTSPAWKVGLISVLFSSLSVVLMYHISKILTKNRFLAIIAALTLAFLYPFWLYAEVVEVFALNSFFIVLLIYLTLKFSERQKNNFIYAISFVAGLSLTNNQVILLLFPPIFIYVLLLNPKILKNIKFLVICTCLFVLGLTPYLYIPIAATQSPAINWGNAVTLKNFIGLVTRKQYGWGKDISTNNLTPLAALKPVFIYWSIYITPLVPIGALAGFIELVRTKKKKLLLFLIAALFLLGPFFVIYGQRGSISSITRLAIIERFLIQSAIIVVIFFSVGLVFVKQSILKIIKNNLLRSAIIAITLIVIAIIPTTTYLVNKERTNLRGIYLGDNLGRDILASATPDSILILTLDNYVFNSLYIQNEYKVQSNVTIVGAHGGFSPLFAHITDKDNFLDNYDVENHNVVDLDMLKIGLLTTASHTDVLVDVSGLIKLTDNETLILIPHGLLQQVYLSDDQLPTKNEFVKEENEVWSKMHTIPLILLTQKIDNDFMLSDIKAVYILAKLRTANFVRSYYHDEELAKRYEHEAQLIAGDHPLDRYRTNLTK